MLGFELNKFIFALINFAILMVLMRLVLFKPLMKTMEARKEKIRKGLETAENAEKVMADANGTAEKIVAEAREEAARLKEEAVRAGQKEKTDIMADARKREQEIIRDTKARLEEEHKRMVADLRNQLLDLVVMATRKVLHEEISAAEQRVLVERAVTASLKELEFDDGPVAAEAAPSKGTKH